MRVFETTKVIDRSPTEVFAFPTDTANGPLLIDEIAALDLVGAEPMGAGARLRATRVFFGRTASEEFNVAAYDPPSRYALRGSEGAVDAGMEFQLEAADRGTRIGMTIRVEFRWLMWVFEPLMSWLVKRQSTGRLAKLKRAFEQGRQVGS